MSATIEPTTALERTPVPEEQRIPTTVSAAWELELLIAGAVTFALFQLPASLETLRNAAEARVWGVGLFGVTLGYVYAKVMVYVLLAAFLLNLTSRAYWVGLVGLHSVFPRGIDWERSRMGPAALEQYRGRVSSLPHVIARVDNFASVIFSFAFLVVVVCVYSLVGSAVVAVLAWGINSLLFGGRHWLAAFETLVLLFTIPLAAIGLIDKKYGSRWPPETRAGRRLRRAVRIATRVNGTTLFGPIYFTLFTNLKRGVMVSIFYATFLLALLVAMVEMLVHLDAIALGTPRYVPADEGIRGVDADHYESLRGPGASSRVPTIQSDVVDGPYVRLFIPLIPERHEPALAATCPDARPLRPGHVHLARPPVDRAAADRAAAAVLRCLARMHAASVDGTPLGDAAFRFYTHPVTGRNGIVAHVPTAGLAPGSHTISVMPPPRAPTSRRRTPLQPTEIPFWK